MSVPEPKKRRVWIRSTVWRVFEFLIFAFCELDTFVDGKNRLLKMCSDCCADWVSILFTVWLYKVICKLKANQQTRKTMRRVNFNGFLFFSSLHCNWSKISKILKEFSFIFTFEIDYEDSDNVYICSLSIHINFIFAPNS
jgi:hypothetical protein